MKKIILITLVGLFFLQANPLCAMEEPNKISSKTELNKKLFDAIVNNDIQEVQNLIQAKVDVNNTQDILRITPLHEAARLGNAPILQALIDAGAQVNARCAVQELTPLHLAAELATDKAADIIKILVLHKADLEAQGHIGGDTPLHLAVARGHLTAIRELVKAGANLEAKNQNFGTPLHLAAWLNRPNTIITLIEVGADVEAKNQDGKTPLDTAFDNINAGKALITTVSPQEVQHVIPAIIALTNPLNDPHKESNLNSDVGYIITNQLIPAIIDAKLTRAKSELDLVKKLISCLSLKPWFKASEMGKYTVSHIPEAELRTAIEQSIRRVLSRPILKRLT